MKNKTEKLFLPYKESLELKKLGFNEECIAYYHNHVEPSFVKGLDSGNTTKNSEQNLYHTDCTAPLFQQVFDWFREKYFIIVIVEPIWVDGAVSPIKYDWSIFSEDFENEDFNTPPFHTYNDAEINVINYIINYINERNKNN